MSLWSLLLIAAGVSADAFAVAVTSGVRMRRLNYGHALIIALVFGAFQAIMPLLGWLLASQFSTLLAPFDHWIAFGLLALIGGKMIWEAFHGDDEAAPDGGKLDLKPLLLLGIATSIDAAAVGVSVALFDVSILLAITVIGVTTFVLSFLAVIVGRLIGLGARKPAEIIGGLVLIFIGVRILIEHIELF